MLWAACCTCFYGFLRSGEVTVSSMDEYDPEADLSEGDVSLDDLVNPTVVRVHIKASKTDPFRQDVYVSLGATRNDLCPVAAVSAYLAVRGRDPGPFFRFASGSALTREALVKQLRSALSQFDQDIVFVLGRRRRRQLLGTMFAREIFRSHAHFCLNHAHFQSFWRETSCPTMSIVPFSTEIFAKAC